MKDGAMIFDFDGLLVDTETVEYQAWEEIFSERGASLPLSVWAECVGATLDDFDPLDHLEESLGVPVERESLRARHEKAFRAAAFAQPIMPGVEKAIAVGRAFGLKMAVASNSDLDWVCGHLEAREALGWFDCVKTGDDVDRGKPAPDLYLAVLEELDLDPEKSIVFEDSPNGARAAKSAGLYCVAVPNPITKNYSIGMADELIDSLEQFSLRNTLSRLGA